MLREDRDEQTRIGETVRVNEQEFPEFCLKSGRDGLPVLVEKGMGFYFLKPWFLSRLQFDSTCFLK